MSWDRPQSMQETGKHAALAAIVGGLALAFVFWDIYAGLRLALLVAGVVPLRGYLKLQSR